jgi:hypothetical protein
MPQVLFSHNIIPAKKHSIFSIYGMSKDYIIHKKIIFNNLIAMYNKKETVFKHKFAT